MSQKINFKPVDEKQTLARQLKRDKDAYYNNGGDIEVLEYVPPKKKKTRAKPAYKRSKQLDAALKALANGYSLETAMKELEGDW